MMDNQGASVGTGYNSGFNFTGATVNDTIDNIDSWQRATKKMYDEQKTQEMEQQSQTMFECAMRTDDGQVRKQNLSGANLNNMEIIIKQAAADHGSKKYEDMGTGQILCEFLNDNPQYARISNGALKGEVTLKTWANNIGARYIDETTSTGVMGDGDSSIGANITQSILDVPLNLGNLPFNLIDKGTAWVAKQFSDNDEAIDQQLQQNLQRREDLMTLPGVNREDLSYQIPNLVTDLGVTVASSFIPGVGEAKWAEWALKYPKLAKLIKYFGSVEKLVEKYPKLKPFLVGGELGVKDTTIMNALEGEGTTPLEALEGFLVGGTVEKVINSLKPLSTFLQTNGLFTSSKAKEIIKKLKDIGGKAPGKGTVDDLADFMTKHGLTGSRKQIIEKAEQLGKDKKAILNELLSKSESTHQLEEADEALELLIKKLEEGLEDAPMLPREGDIAELNDLLAKQGNYTLRDLERIKEKIDDLLRLYNKNGNPKDTKSAELWIEERKVIQKYIEDVAKKEGLGEVALLNNEIQTAYSIADGISNKTLQDTVKNAIGEYGIYGTFSIPVVKDIWDGNYEKALKDGTMALFFGNTWFKTHLGSMLNRMSGTNRYEIDQWIASEGRNKLSESASQEVADILSQDLGFKERAKQYITSLIKEGAIIGGQKGTEIVVDNMTN